MKKTILFSLLLLLLAVACKHHVNDDAYISRWPEFVDVYAEKETLPDSVMVMETFRFYDSLMPGRDYLHHDENLSFHKARASYYKAIMEEFETKQYVLAFSDYLDALWIMEGLIGERSVFAFSNDNPDYKHFTAILYDRLAWLLYTHDAWETSLECLEKSSNCFKTMGDAKGMASNYELMGDVLLAQGDKVKSMAYYKRSDSIQEHLKTDHIYQTYSSVIHRALDMFNANEKAACLALLHHLLQETQSPWLKKQVRFSLGYFYLEDHEYDSALYNYEQSYPLLPRQTLKSYSRIVQISNFLGDTLKAGYYGELLADAYLKQFARSNDRAKMDLVYQEYKDECADVKHKDTLLFVLICILLLLFILCVLSLIFVKRKYRHQEEIAARERIQATLEDEIETVKSVSQKKEETIKALQSKLDKVISNPDFHTLPFDKKLEALNEMPICKRILNVRKANVKAFSSYPELALSENQKTMLVNAVDAVFPKFSVRIIEMFPRLKRSDVVYCCMYILGITEAQAAALTGKTYQAVWTRSLKLHEIFDNKSSLQLILHGYLKDWQSK